MRIAFLSFIAALLGAPALPAMETIYTSPPLTATQREKLIAQLDSRWNTIQRKPSGLGVREVFAFALESAEARYAMDRIDGALGVAEQMQDRDPDSATYGNLRWLWGDVAPMDRNAVEFTMQDASLLWMRHRDELSSPALVRLERLIDFGVEGIRRHRVSENYTNIFLMKTWNCIALGENTDRPDLAGDGYGMFDAWLINTWENGIHEYISPTYYGVDLDSLGLLARFARNDRVRAQAESALRLFWTDIAFNWIEECGRLGGSHSRDYDYLTGHGMLDRHLRYVNWLSPDPSQPPYRFAALADWRPTADLRDLATSRRPRMVRQRWGSTPGQRSAHWVGRSVSLGSAGAAYGPMDKPLAVNFAGGPTMSMVNFCMDARDDPYGKKREPTGGGHRKALHLVPFLMGVQHQGEALLLASTSPEDSSFQKYAPNPTCLLSQLVLPRGGVSLWVGDEATALTAENSTRSLSIVQPVFIRYGTSVAGFRILHAADLRGDPAPIELRYDGRYPQAMTLTVVHSATTPTLGRASAALYARVAEDLDDAAFTNFRQEFANAPAQVSFVGGVLSVGIEGRNGNLQLGGNSETGERLVVEGDEPEAANRLLSVDGEDTGRDILESTEPVSTFKRVLDSLDPVFAIPLDRPFEAEESPLIIAPFEVARDLGASGGKYIWMPGEPEGKGSSNIARAVYQIDPPHPGAYYIWGRIRAPTPSDDSFFLRIRTRDSVLLEKIDWHTGRHPDWEWTRFKRHDDGTSEIDLPSGPAMLEVLCREDGTALDQIVLTTRPDWQPLTRSRRTSAYR